MDEPRIIFTLYANHMHSELPRRNFKRMLQEREMEQMIGRIGVPITYITQGEDVDLYKRLSPGIVKAINENPNVRPARGTYTAALPTISFNQTKMQIDEADKVLDISFQGKMEKLRFFPEHDFHPEIWDITGKVEPTMILEDAHHYYEHRRDILLPEARMYTKGKHVIGVPYDGKKVPVLVNKGIRNAYLTFFRGMNKATDVVNAFQDELSLAKQNGEPCAFFLIDAEVPQINEVNGQPRLDKWEELMGALKESELSQHFKHYSQVEDDVLNHVENSPAYTVDRRTLPKWDHSPKSQKRAFDAISEAGRKGLMDKRYFQFVGMHAQFKDVLSWAMLKTLNGKPLSEQDVDYTLLQPDQIQDKVIELPTDRGSNVKITSDNLRLSEFKHFIQTLEAGNNLLQGVEKLDPSLQYVVKALHEVYSEK